MSQCRLINPDWFTYGLEARSFPVCFQLPLTHDHGRITPVFYWHGYLVVSITWNKQANSTGYHRPRATSHRGLSSGLAPILTL